MKNILVLLLLGFMLSCTKQDAQQTTPQPSDPISDTQWHGEFFYANQSTRRVFTIQFKKDGDFIWQDMSGSYDGTWNLNEANDKVTITFKANGIQTSFTLLGTTELARPQNLNHSHWVILDPALRKIELPFVQNIGAKLPKTQWLGRLENYLFVFDETGTGKVTWRWPRNGNAVYGHANYTLTSPVVLADEADMAQGYRCRFFGVFINEKTLRVNSWIWKPGQEQTTLRIENSEDYSLK
ncbi:hypothetical protein [Spirosoma sp. KNUC1025]|uniref:hypothetical protein n=1 Tax=Spirosoma sp. KNUC1025 TaxID=2894082 RepID=UPI00386F95C9|nr:hypothetical protein LN737_25910 [Spirosoma sp. KNUC1025]